MKSRHHYEYRRTEHHPRVSLGIFFIVLGIALLIATNDVFNLGSMSSYFNWKTAMIFIGVLLLLNLEFTGGLMLIAGGIWFLQDELFPFNLDTFRIFFWPSVITLVGLSFIISAFTKRKSIK
jgi:chromate transport protein ChrA